MGLSDGVSDIRQGEELPETKIMAFLPDKIPDIQEPVVIQQFPHGQTTDKRFKSFAGSVHALIKAANMLIKGEIQ